MAKIHASQLNTYLIIEARAGHGRNADDWSEAKRDWLQLGRIRGRIRRRISNGDERLQATQMTSLAEFDIITRYTPKIEPKVRLRDPETGTVYNVVFAFPLENQRQFLEIGATVSV